MLRAPGVAGAIRGSGQWRPGAFGPARACGAQSLVRAGCPEFGSGGTPRVWFGRDARRAMMPKYGSGACMRRCCCCA
eukprot:2882992-Prymnesium_polylepis.1